MEKKTCVRCGEGPDCISLGEGQHICFGCLKEDAFNAACRLDGEERKIVIGMLEIIAAHYGYKV